MQVPASTVTVGCHRHGEVLRARGRLPTVERGRERDVAGRDDGRTAEQIFGYPDYLKVRSSMTLFAHAAVAAGEDPADFGAVLDAFYAGFPDGREDPATLELLAQA